MGTKELRQVYDQPENVMEIIKLYHQAKRAPIFDVYPPKNLGQSCGIPS